MPATSCCAWTCAAHFADPVRMRDRLAGPRTTVAEVDCNHWPLTERPVEVREAIERWFGERFGEGAADSARPGPVPPAADPIARSA